jgi:hypothetical protein
LEALVSEDAAEMTEVEDPLLALDATDVPERLRTWLVARSGGAALASLELLEDGRLVVETVTGLDPQFVARLQRTLAQYEDVLRRLT